MNFNISFWEKQTFAKDPDTIVLGGGLVGINAAISLKEAEPNRDVLIIDRGAFPLGASTRNAGFACFGSVTELLDDLSSESEENVYKLLGDRIAGLEYLKQRVGVAELDYSDCGGYEVFDTKLELDNLNDQILPLNSKIEEITGLKNTFSIVEREMGFNNFHQAMIYNQYEGCLHPGKMMWQLYNQAQNLGIRFINGTHVDSVNEFTEGVTVRAGSFAISCKSIIVCTNGFTDAITFNSKIDLIKKESTDIEKVRKILPARNQVLVTEAIPGLEMNSCYHYDKGYVYFRNIDDRILIGGGRNIMSKEEETSEFGLTKKIKEYLLDILINRIGVNPEIKIDFEWSGIMGTGPVKSPILRKHSEHIIFAVRLGGMGVALGSLLGDKAAKLLLNNNANA